MADQSDMLVGGGYGSSAPRPEAPTTAQIDPSALGDLFKRQDFLNADYETQHKQLTRVGQAAFNYIQAHPEGNDERTADIFAEKMSEAYDLIKPPEPHGFFGSISAPFKEEIIPAAATAAGGIAAGTAALPGGPVAVAAADIAGGTAAGTMAATARDSYRGPIATMRARKQLEADREAHSVGYAIGSTVPAILSFAGGGGPKQAVTKLGKVGKAAVGGARAGASIASQGVFGGIKGSSFSDIPKAMAEGAVTMGPLGLLGPAKTFLRAIGIKAPAEAVTAAASKALYDASAEALAGKPVDLKKHFEQFTGGVSGGIPVFIILNALSSLVHGRAKPQAKPAEVEPMTSQSPQPVETEQPATPNETRHSPETPPVQATEILPGDQRGSESVQPEAPPSGSNHPVTPPVPPIAISPEEARTSLKFAVVDQERLDRGLEKMPPSDGQGIKNAFARAAAAEVANDNIGKETLASLKASPRPIEPHESALMLAYKSRLRGTERALEEKLGDPTLPDAERSGAQETLDYVQGELQDIYDVMGRKGPATMASLVLLMQKEWAKEDNSELAIKAQMKAANGGPLSKPQEAKAKDIAEKFKRNQKKADDLQAKTDERERTAGVQKIYDGLKKEAKTTKPKSSFQDFIDKQIQDAKDRLSGKSGKLFASVDPLGIADHVIIGAGYLAKGVIKAAEWTAAMVKEFGEGVRPYLAEIHAKAQELHLQWKRDFAANAKATTPEGIMADVQPSDGAPDPKIAIKLFQSHIAAGVEGAENVAKSVHNDILTKFPNATLQQTRDAISGYGKVKLPSQQENKIKERDYRRQLQLISSLERARQKLAPLKSGPQRDKASAEVRDLEKQLKDAMVEFQIETKSPAKQLADARTAIISRLTNQIEDLNRIIAGNVKQRAARKPVEYDAQMKALEKERNELKSYVDDLTGKPDMTAADWNKIATKAAQASEKYYRNRISAKDYTARKNPSFAATQATKDARAQRDEARKEYQDLREASGVAAAARLESATKAAENRLEELRNELITGQKPAAGKAPTVTPELQAMRDEASRLSNAIRDITGSGNKARVEAAAKSIQKSIDELDRHIKQSDFSKATKTPPFTTPELEALRHARDTKRNQYRQMLAQERAMLREIKAAAEEAKNPSPTSEQIALKNLKSRLNKSIDTLKKQISTGNFDKPTRQQIADDAESTRLKAEKAQLVLDKKMAIAKIKFAAGPWWLRAFQHTGNIAREGALSGYHTLAKLGGFSATRLMEAPLLEATGKFWESIPGIKRIFERARFEGGASASALARLYSGYFTKGMQEAWQQLLTKQSETRSLYDKPHVEPDFKYQIFGNIHAAEKTPLLVANFEMNLRRLREKGVPITEEVKREAYEHAKRAILQEANEFAQFLNSLHARLEAPNAKTGKPSLTKAGISTFIKVFLTKGIVKTPANYVMQTLERTPLGLLRGLGKAGAGLRKGLDSLHPAETDVIARLLKVGAVGSAFFLWGALDALRDPKDRVFGGYYEPGKRDDSDAKFGSTRLFGTTFKILLHNPLTEVAQMGSTMVRAALGKFHKKDVETRGYVAGFISMFLGLAEHAPVAGQGMRLAKLGDPAQQQSTIGEALRGLIPMFVQNLAEDMDKAESRKAKSYMDHMKLGVPGLRETLPPRR